MKLFAAILLTVFLSKSCEGQTKNDLKLAAIEYTASTRGFYQKIIVENQAVAISRDRSGTEKPVTTKISDKDWKELVGYFETLNLDSLETLKAPTEKRIVDAAAFASLKVTYKDKTYQSNSFDHGYPPGAIKKIVDKLNTFAKKE
jgi:hypothetical protein